MIWRIFEVSDQQLRIAFEGLDLPMPFHRLGEEYLSDSLAFPAIVWVPMGGPVTSARQSRADTTAQRSDGSTNLGIKELAERHETVRVHVWNADFKSTEILVGHFVAILRRPTLTGFSFSVRDMRWSIGPQQKTQEPTEEKQSGTLCILEMELRIPLTFEPIGVSQPPHTATVVPVVNHQA